MLLSSYAGFFSLLRPTPGLQPDVMSMLLKSGTLLLLAAATCLHVQAQPQAVALSPEEIAARRESVTTLEAHIAQREARLAEWAKDIVELDARIEKRVDELVKMLAGLRDSEESRSKVTQIKKDAIEGLKRGIELYTRKRKEIRELVRTGGTSAAGDLGKFDERIIKRVDQIAELTKSIPTHQDVAKYESDGGSYWNGYYYESSRISEEWKQNRRDDSRANQVRDETSKALRETLDRLDQRRRSLKDLLANRNLTPAAKDLYNSELGQIDAYEDHLNAQLRDITTASGGGATQAVGRDQAHDIESLIDDARKDLREDVARLFRSYDQFVKGRAYLAGLNENLAARKKWLEENAK